MNREAIVFGRQRNLVGILSHAGREDVGSTGVLMLTAGMLPSCGPYRLHTHLAERFMTEGVSSLRFDLSGIGESLGVGAVGDSLSRASQEVSSAIDELGRRTGCERAILFGLCSGADDAVQAAMDDDRVDGLVLVDGCGYVTDEFKRRRLFNHYGYRLFQPATWRRKLRSRFGKGQTAAAMPMGLDIREFPDRETATVVFQRLVDRGVRLQFLYTGGVADYYNYADQLWDMLPGVDWKGLAETQFFPAMDHTAMLCEDREVLLDTVVQGVKGMITPTQSIGDGTLSADDTLPMIAPPNTLPVAVGLTSPGMSSNPGTSVPG